MRWRVRYVTCALPASALRAGRALPLALVLTGAGDVRLGLAAALRLAAVLALAAVPVAGHGHVRRGRLRSALGLGAATGREHSCHGRRRERFAELHERRA